MILESEKERFMRRALSLAKRGAGKVNPNPMVGAVLVRNGEVVGEGYHRYFGAPHAEVEALRQAGERARGAHLYVNLEPCCHYGKTPPCTDAIIGAGVRKVIVSNVDPNPLVSGKGLRILRGKGVEVETGVLESEGERLNEMFFHFHRTGMPFVSVKIAMTVDGFIADHKGNSRWITGGVARKYVHKLRAMHDAVVVGAGTVLSDDPQLNVRLKGRWRQPVRVVLDPRGKVTGEFRVFQSPGGPVYHLIHRERLRTKRETSRGDTRVRVLGLSPEDFSAEKILSLLKEEGVTSVLVEGGRFPYSMFVGGSLVQKFYIFLAPKILGRGISPFELIPPREMGNEFSLEIKEVKRFGEDLCLIARLRRN